MRASKLVAYPIFRRCSKLCSEPVGKRQIVTRRDRIAIRRFSAGNRKIGPDSREGDRALVGLANRACGPQSTQARDAKFHGHPASASDEVVRGECRCSPVLFSHRCSLVSQPSRVGAFARWLANRSSLTSQASEGWRREWDSSTFAPAALRLPTVARSQVRRAKVGGEGGIRTH
jgi:hypothetical protein